MSAPGAVREPMPGAEAGFQRILLASEGRPISEAAIDRTIELAAASGASVHVFSIARVHGVAFGMPNPGRRKGIESDGHVLGTRKSTKRILDEAAKEGCEAIVMAADPDRNRVVGDLLWSQEPQRVRRRSKLPVILVVDADDDR
jgi:nucleotide-binding universal stress UspA family protein